MDGEGTPIPLIEERDCRRDPLRARTLACLCALHRRWAARDRQQRRRTGLASGRLRTEKLPLRRIRLRRRRCPAMYTLIARPSSPDSTRSSICAQCWLRSLIIPPARSTICSPGTWPPCSRTHLPRLPKTHSSTKKVAVEKLGAASEVGFRSCTVITVEEISKRAFWFSQAATALRFS